MSFSDQKKHKLRQQVKAARERLGVVGRFQKSTLISARAIECLTLLFGSRASHSHNRTLLSYMPFRTEVDVTPIMEWCWREGIPVAVPRIDKGSREMEFFYIRSYDDLEAGAFGIREPNVSCMKIDSSLADAYMLVPGLAFDKKGGRLGYGGGYYDRYFRRLIAANACLPYKLGLAFDVQVVTEVPMDKLDIRMDQIITEIS